MKKNKARYFVTFCVSRRRRKIYCGHACLSVCLSAAVRPHYYTDPDAHNCVDCTIRSVSWFMRSQFKCCALVPYMEVAQLLEEEKDLETTEHSKLMVSSLTGCALWRIQIQLVLSCPLANEKNKARYFVTFCVSRRRRKMYCGHARLSVCLSVCLSAAVRPHYCTDPDVTWGHGRGCSLVVHYWADLQSGHGLHCYGNITKTLEDKSPIYRYH